MNPAWHLCVLIPARNEELLLPRCLESILNAREHLGWKASLDIIVAADLCTDRTAQIARAMLMDRGTVIEVRMGSAGGARSLAAKRALQSTQVPRSRCWLSNTDADCVVPLTWLSDQLTLVEHGVEAVAGTVAVDSFAEHGPEVPARFKASYRIEPDGSHCHVHGANIGVRADAYLEVGGWENLQTAEDHDLWRRLKHFNKRVLSTSRIEVITSGRREGRAPKGFAGALAAHNEVTA